MKNLIIPFIFLIFTQVSFAQCNNVDEAKINSLTDKVSKQHLDNNKLKLIQDYLNTDCIKSAQLLILIKSLNFEVGIRCFLLLVLLFWNPLCFLMHI